MVYNHLRQMTVFVETFHFGFFFVALLETVGMRPKMTEVLGMGLGKHHVTLDANLGHSSFCITLTSQ